MKRILPIHSIYIAIFLIVVGLGLSLSYKNKSTNVTTQQLDNASIMVIDVSKPDKKDRSPLIIGLTCVAAGLLLAARNLQLKTNRNKSVPDLTQKEREIVNLIKEGHSNKEIAQKLNISLSTVKSHTSNIYKKLQINSRTDLLNTI